MMTKTTEDNRVTVAFGTRPEAIKLAPLIKELQQNQGINLAICATGQHREMLDQALEVFGVVPTIDFMVMRENQNLHETFSAIFLAFKAHIDEFKPNLVLVHGDTTTAAAVGLACFFSRVRVAHIEAGLRTGNLQAPFPEEFNRQLVSKIASYHFAPTLQNAQNLQKELLAPDSIFITGNTVVDALEIIKKGINSGESNSVIQNLKSELGFDFEVTPFVLITAHRRENFGHGLEQICDAIAHLAAKHPSIYFVFPVHLNPNVQRVVRKSLEGLENVKLTSPRDYVEFIVLLKFCIFVLSDSGGIQEEAPSFKKPLILLRENTERPEALTNKTAFMVGTETSSIIETFDMVLSNIDAIVSSLPDVNPFGDGISSDRIIQHINRIFRDTGNG